MVLARHRGDLLDDSPFHSIGAQRLLNANAQDVLEIDSIVRFEDQLVEFEERFYAGVQLVGPVEPVRRKYENELGVDALREPAHEKRQEGVTVSPDVVDFVDEQDQVAAIVRQLRLDPKH
jgi:hypothetical protein